MTTKRKEVDPASFGPLGRIIHEAIEAAVAAALPRRLRRNEVIAHLSVMGKAYDPYRQDTPEGHRDAQWLMAQLARPEAAHIKHARGLHYLLGTLAVTKPNG